MMNKQNAEHLRDRCLLHDILQDNGIGACQEDEKKGVGPIFTKKSWKVLKSWCKAMGNRKR